MHVSSPLPEDYRPGTLPELFLDGLSRPRDDAARTRGADGVWISTSTDEIGRRARAIALGLRAKGFVTGDRVAILSQTRLEWAVADWGLITAGLTSVPVYPVLPSEQVQYILADSGARAVFVEDQEQLDKLAEIEPNLPDLELAIAFEPVTSPAGSALETMQLDGLSRLGESAPDVLASTYESHARKTRPEDLATLIYTSGTTGDPKGVMLTHGNFHSNSDMALRVFPISSTDVALALLPLAHVFERTVGHYIMWRAGVTVAYAESPTTAARDLGEVSPTFMAAVPRVFEKVLESAEGAAREAGGAKEKIFGWARRVGERRAMAELEGRGIGPVLAAQAALADRLVFSKLRARTGGRIRYFVSGGAPLPLAVGRFFFAARLPVVEGYGLTETSPALSFNPVDAIRLGTVGKPIPGTEVRIAEDGEILARGPQIMAGYFNKPEATAEAIDDDGWFHTGDVGEIDEDGYLRITDRKKDLLITAYGKNIAPQPIEAEIKRHPLVAEAVMLGDQRKFPVVVIVPEYTVLRPQLHGVEEAADADLASDPQTRSLLEGAVRERCAEFAHYERPRELLVVPGPFTIEGGELTPTLKVKRRVIQTRFADAIDALYERAEDAMSEREKKRDRP
ncbi:AMP-dependent synthetase/ligase [Candidatus Palauibacter sp.]|uniref:AMP-dependent synthetase/ligase n=1 Tax=Candidatus Palauibacter sp. TaxID=3101350 RepID=UPI003B5BDE94